MLNDIHVRKCREVLYLTVNGHGVGRVCLPMVWPPEPWVVLDMCMSMPYQLCSHTYSSQLPLNGITRHSQLSCPMQLRVVLDMRRGQDQGLYGAARQICYHAMGLVHSFWTPIPGTMKVGL